MSKNYQQKEKQHWATEIAKFGNDRRLRGIDRIAPQWNRRWSQPCHASRNRAQEKKKPSRRQRYLHKSNNAMGIGRQNSKTIYEREIEAHESPMRRIQESGKGVMKTT